MTGAWHAIRRLEARLKGLCEAVQLLPALTPHNAASERRRLMAELSRGGVPAPRWGYRAARVPPVRVRELDALRRSARAVPGAELYLAKLDELELDLALLEALGDTRRVRPLSARRFGTGAVQVPTEFGPMSLGDYARLLLGRVSRVTEPRVLPPQGARREPSFAAMIRTLATYVGLSVEVVVEPRLAAGAATGERTIYIADRMFGPREAWRIAIHEVLGHLTVAANARAQPLRILQWGTSDSFTDQEGLALWLEESSGAMDEGRLRTLAARVLAADWVHDGAAFGDTATRLHRELGFCVREATVIAERVHRGGGVARDVAYLRGWLRVRHALGEGQATVDELRAGRVALEALPAIRTLVEEGFARHALYRPNFSRSLRATGSGTKLSMSPLSEATSLTRLEAT